MTGSPRGTLGTLTDLLLLNKLFALLSFVVS